MAGYCFRELEEPLALKLPLRDYARGLGIFGTVLLANEGVNSFFAGEERAARLFAERLRSHFPNIRFQESWSEVIPFKRMLVKVKREVIRMEKEFCDLSAEAPHMSPKELKARLDAGEDIVLLDTRKKFEFELGSFNGAIPIEMKHFRRFPEHIEALEDDLKNRTIVTFCTGGIRCEKAAPWMIQKGFKSVYQLEGGVLKYFEDCGSAHWWGKCFVFDHRVLLEPDLSVATHLECRVCNALYERPQSEMLELGLYMACPSCLDAEKRHSA